MDKTWVFFKQKNWATEKLEWNFDGSSSFSKWLYNMNLAAPWNLASRQRGACPPEVPTWAMGGLLPKPVTRKEIEEHHLDWWALRFEVLMFCFTVLPPDLRRFDGMDRNPRMAHNNGSKRDILFTILLHGFVQFWISMLNFYIYLESWAVNFAEGFTEDCSQWFQWVKS